MRLNFSFDYTIDIESEIESEIELLKIPPMLLQPFVENSVQHGFKALERKGVIQIKMSYVGQDMIQIDVEDNGVGRQKATQQTDTSHASYATIITQERIQGFNMTHTNPISLEVQDLVENESSAGTRVRFLIPILLS